jgi:branched-chain amino acid transport system substrate-binding protein
MAALITLVGSTCASAQTPTVRIAVSASLSGSGAFAGRAQMDAVRFAIDEVNATNAVPRIELTVHDDGSTEQGARDTARQIVGEDALAVIGPSLTTSSLAAGPFYAEQGMVSVVPTAHGNAIINSGTTFRTVFSTGEIGEALANYLHHILHGRKAVVVYRNNGYGKPLADGFRRNAERYGLEAQFFPFENEAQREAAARQALAAPDHPAIVLGSTFEDAVPLLVTLRRNKVKGAIFGTATMARAGFADLFRNEPEARNDPGFFTDGVYAVAPMIFDSAYADALNFAERYQARYGREPSWESAQGYDAVRLLTTAIRATYARTASSDLRARRQAIQTFLDGLDSPAKAISGVTGPIWFAPPRNRQQAVRMGRFQGTLYESAPIQLVPVSVADRAELASGALIDAGDGRLLRRQRVVSTGMYLNEIYRIDVAQSTFSADLYIWLRYAQSADAGLADPNDIELPELVRGTLDRSRPALERDLDDGTTYRLWRVRGDFKNDFDLHRYPRDRQTLVIRLFNSRSAADRIIYAQDRRTLHADEPSAPTHHDANPAAPGAASDEKAFRNLTQWEALHTGQRRDVLVTDSALGDPGLVGVERVRELSGYRVEVDVRRLTASTLAKTLLPLGIMTLIMFASLYFPHGLVKEKVTVAITAALSGAVLLSSVNAQLGGIGYTIAIEYVFYLFFGLCLLCIVSILTAERLRVAKRDAAAVRTETLTHGLFLLAIAGTIAVAWYLALHW